MNVLSNEKTNTMKIKRMTALAMFTALAYICVFVFKFPLGFLTFDAKDAIITVAGMFFGPISALVMSLVVSFAEFATISGTGVYGLIMNFAASAAFSVTASLIYKHRRKMSGAVIGLTSSVFTMTALMMVMNLIITPFFLGTSVKAVAQMIPTMLLPFNLVKAVFNASLVLLLYKPLTTAVRRAKLVSSSTDAETELQSKKATKKTTIITVSVAAVVFAATLVVFFFVLNGSFSLTR